MDKYERNLPGALTIEEIQAGANKWDDEHVKHQKGSEKDHRKKKDGRFSFFIEMNLWWHRRCLYRWLVNFHNGKNVKLKRLRKACKQNDITQPSHSTMASNNPLSRKYVSGKLR